MHQHVEIIGRLGKDPELRFTQSGTAVCSFSVAVSRKYKQGDEWQEETTWFDVTVWGDQGQRAADWLSKGYLVHVVGDIRTRTYQDRDGNTRHAWGLTAQRFNNLTPRDGSGQQSNSQAPTSRGTQDDFDSNQSFSDEDIPF